MGTLTVHIDLDDGSGTPTKLGPGSFGGVAGFVALNANPVTNAVTGYYGRGHLRRTANRAGELQD